MLCEEKRPDCAARPTQSGTCRKFFALRYAYAALLTAGIGNLSALFLLSVNHLLLYPERASAQDESASITPEDLARVKSRIAREEERFETLKKSLKESEKENERLKKELADLGARKEQIFQELSESRTKLAHLGAKVDENRRALDSRRNGMKQRITAIYKAQKRTGSLDYLFESRSAMDLLKRSNYLRRLTAYDKSFTARVEGALEALSRDQKSLDQVKDELTRQLDENARAEQDLNKKREQQAKLLDDTKAKAQQQEKSLGRLRAEAERLEKVIANLTGGEDTAPDVASVPPEDIAPVPPSPGVPAPAPIQISREPFNGRGLQPLKGGLKFPVKGELVRRFGMQKHEEFADMLFLKGVEVRSQIGEKVRAIADGKVLMSQVLPGYGNVIIVDHGQRYYTLYGRLASSLKGVGDLVKRGEVVAVLGEPDYRSRNFYFELRVKGKATDPMGFFADPPRQMAAPASEGET